jgi:hypothetical protein
MTAGAPQSRKVSDLFHANHLRSFVLSLLPVFWIQSIFYIAVNFFEHLGIEE